MSQILITTSSELINEIADFSDPKFLDCLTKLELSKSHTESEIGTRLSTLQKFKRISVSEYQSRCEPPCSMKSLRHKILKFNDDGALQHPIFQTIHKHFQGREEKKIHIRISSSKYTLSTATVESTIVDGTKMAYKLSWLNTNFTWL